MVRDVRRFHLEFGVAVLAIVAVICLRWLLDPILGDNQPFCTLYGAVAIAVWYGGYRPALVATAFGYLMANYLFIEPRGSVVIRGRGDFVGLLAYLFSCSIIIGFGEAMRRGRRKLKDEKAKVQVSKAAHQAATQQLQIVTESTEAVLAESERRFRQLAESINEVFWMADPQSTQILYISPAYERVWGRSCESLYEQPRSFLDAIHSADRERVRIAVLEKQSRGEPTDEVYRVIRPDGSMRWVRDRAFAVRDAAGRVYRMAGIAEDITEKKQTEDAARPGLSGRRPSPITASVLELAYELS
jgi:PAS domain S-box-containing protein